MTFPTEWKVIKAMFQTTNRSLYFHDIPTSYQLLTIHCRCYPVGSVTTTNHVPNHQPGYQYDTNCDSLYTDHLAKYSLRGWKNPPTIIVDVPIEVPSGYD